MAWSRRGRVEERLRRNAQPRMRPESPENPPFVATVLTAFFHLASTTPSPTEGWGGEGGEEGEGGEDGEGGEGGEDGRVVGGVEGM